MPTDDAIPPAGAIPPALEIDDLRFRYRRSGEPFELAVRRLVLDPGAQCLLTGSSGTGKSTLLHLVCGLERPSAGTVRVAGEDVHALAGAARDLFRGRRIGMIFQAFHLLPGFTATENVMLALTFSSIPPAEHAERAGGLLRRLGIERPHRAAEAFSIGQQQRIALARALACEPALVLADEPTASLDPANATVAMDLIQSGCRDVGAALLCVSHDPAMTERFERVETLEGLAAADDTTADDTIAVAGSAAAGDSRQSGATEGDR